MMKIFASLLLAAFPNVDAITRIAVVELGIGGTVRRTTSQSNLSTVEGVNSFFQAMHGARGRPQHAGMPLVPDLFKKADSGVVVGLFGQGVDVAEMPSISALLEEEKDGVVGHLSTNGMHCHSFVSVANSVQEVTSGLSLSVENASNEKSLSALKMSVKDSSAATTVDQEVSEMIRSMHKKAMEQSKTVILYLVVEEDASISRRRLNDGEAQENNGQYESNKIYFLSKENGDDSESSGHENPNAETYAAMFPAYYGYGYFNSYGEWVTPYKSMFQIQYFNVVLWTAVGLSVVLIWVMMMMMYMPLEPDTLLFGESAKMIGDD